MQLQDLIEQAHTLRQLYAALDENDVSPRADERRGWIETEGYDVLCQLVDLLSPPQNPGCGGTGDCHDGCHIHTCARMFHEGDPDTEQNVEELEEVLDLNGATLAYFTDTAQAEAYCAWMYAQRRHTPEKERPDELAFEPLKDCRKEIALAYGLWLYETGAWDPEEAEAFYAALVDAAP